MTLWWLEPGWAETCCANCGANIRDTGGDPDWGYCYPCFSEHLRQQERAREIEASAKFVDDSQSDADSHQPALPTAEAHQSTLIAAERRGAERMREAAALAVHDIPREGREWVPGSLWDSITGDNASRIRTLPLPGDEESKA